MFEGFWGSKFQPGKHGDVLCGMCAKVICNLEDGGMGAENVIWVEEGKRGCN